MGTHEQNITDDDEDNILEVSLPEVFQSKKREKILVIKLGALGDIIQCFGHLRAIRNHHKDKRIHILTTKAYAPILSVSPYVDEVEIDVRPKVSNPKAWFKLRRWFKEQNFTEVFDLQNNDRTRLYRRLCAGKTVGKWHGLSKLEKDAAQNMHAYLRDQNILETGGIKPDQPDHLHWLVGGVSTFSLRAPYVLLVPGCAPTRPDKRWTPEHYARFAQFIAADGYQPVILGTEAEELTAQVITDQCPEALSLISQTNFAEIAELARGASFAVGNDTGPMHIIGVTDCPCLVLFGSDSDPQKHRPLGAHVQTLQTQDLNTLKPEKVLRYFKPRFSDADKHRKVLH